jgi:hypothetical protein
VFVLIFGVPFFGWISIGAVSVGLPFILTTSFGTNGSHEFIVEKAEGWSHLKCRRKIELRLPISFNELCGFSDEFRNSLRPGMVVTVSGRSTHFGVFVSEVRAFSE